MRSFIFVIRTLGNLTHQCLLDSIRRSGSKWGRLSLVYKIINVIRCVKFGITPICSVFVFTAITICNFSYIILSLLRRFRYAIYHTSFSLLLLRRFGYAIYYTFVGIEQKKLPNWMPCVPWKKTSSLLVKNRGRFRVRMYMSSSHTSAINFTLNIMVFDTKVKVSSELLTEKESHQAKKFYFQLIVKENFFTLPLREPVFFLYSQEIPPRWKFLVLSRLHVLRYCCIPQVWFFTNLMVLPEWNSKNATGEKWCSVYYASIRFRNFWKEYESKFRLVSSLQTNMNLQLRERVKIMQSLGYR